MKGETRKRAFVLAGARSLGACEVGMLESLVDAADPFEIGAGRSPPGDKPS